VLITSFGPWALPQMVQKFYSIRSKADVKRAMTIATVFALFMSFGAYYSGALTHLFFTDPKTDLAPIVDAATHKPNLDLLMPFFITSYVPQWLVLIILLMVFSASMSSLSSLALVSSSAIAIDLYGASGNREKNPKRTMILMRVLCAVFVALSLLIAVSRVDVIVNLMVIAWGALSGAFLAPYVYGLFWRRTTKAGAYAGMISGVGMAVVLFFLWGKPLIPVAGAIAMFLPLLVVPVVSLLTHRIKIIFPFRLERGLELLGKQRKEFARGEGPLRAGRAGASESLGQGEASKSIENPAGQFVQGVVNNLPRT
jgi:Na+/proline symporter